jgi:alkane 1-monooxygenase
LAAAGIPLPEAPSAPRAGVRETTALFGRHLLAFWFPGTACLFLATGPHPWYLALPFGIPLFAAHWIDVSGRRELRQPPEGLPDAPFDAIVYALAAIQLLNIALLVRLFAIQGLLSFDFLVAHLVVGASSGYSIITAHELIHRRGRWPQRLGRALLCTVLYEHFYTEHLRGHHLRVATPDDPATARFGESFHQFYRRTVPAQLASAWRLEKKRLGDESMSSLDPRLLRSRVLHGLAVEAALAAAIALAFGWVAFTAFVLQALLASRLLEVVNYFEHWGLQRSGPRVGPTESWDTHSWFTYWSLIGLSRHADHHSYGSRPFQRLRVVPDAPLLPSGYVGTIFLVMARNREFRRLASEELQRRRLGPFREPCRRSSPHPPPDLLDRREPVETSGGAEGAQPTAPSKSSRKP